MTTAGKTENSVIITSDGRAAGLAGRLSRVPRLEATTTVVPRWIAARKAMITILKRSANYPHSIVYFPNQMTTIFRISLISNTTVFSKNIIVPICVIYTRFTLIASKHF